MSLLIEFVIVVSQTVICLKSCIVWTLKLLHTASHWLKGRNIIIKYADSHKCKTGLPMPPGYAQEEVPAFMKIRYWEPSKMNCWWCYGTIFWQIILVYDDSATRFGSNSYLCCLAKIVVFIATYWPTTHHPQPIMAASIAHRIWTISNVHPNCFPIDAWLSIGIC